MDQLRNVEQVEELCRYPPILPLIPPICLAPPKLALLLVSIQHQIPSEGGLIWPPLPSPPSSPAPLSPSLDASLCLGCRIDKLSDIPLPLGNAASGGCSGLVILNPNTGRQQECEANIGPELSK